MIKVSVSPSLIVHTFAEKNNGVLPQRRERRGNQQNCFIFLRDSARQTVVGGRAACFMPGKHTNSEQGLFSNGKLLANPTHTEGHILGAVQALMPNAAVSESAHVNIGAFEKLPFYSL